MCLNGFHNMTSIQADASKFDYSTVTPISFALVDLDLYLPMKSALLEVFSVISHGGVLVADDREPSKTTMALIRPSLNSLPVNICPHVSISIGWASP